MTQSAVVKRILADGRAEVLVNRGTACGGNCGSCGGTCSFQNKLTVTCVNPIGAQVGDKVTIASQTRRILGAAALVYLVPVVSFFLFYFLGTLWFPAENPRVLISLIGFFLGVAVVVLINRSSRREKISFEIVGLE